MSVLERFLRDYGSRYSLTLAPPALSYDDLLVEGTAPPAFSFPDGPADALAAKDEYLGLVATWDAEGRTLADTGVPRPPSTLRNVPPV